MSWISDLKELFSRTELEKKISEATLQAEAAVKISDKMNDFREVYGKVSQCQDTKNITDKLLKKIEIL